MERFPVCFGPRDDVVVVGRIGIDSDDHFGPPGIAIAPGGVRRTRPMGGTVNRVKVHGGMHCRNLLPPLHVKIDGLVTQLVDKISPPVPLVTGRVDWVEHALHDRHRHGANQIEGGGQK